MPRQLDMSKDIRLGPVSTVDRSESTSSRPRNSQYTHGPYATGSSTHEMGHSPNAIVRPSPTSTPNQSPLKLSPAAQRLEESSAADAQSNRVIRPLPRSRHVRGGPHSSVDMTSASSAQPQVAPVILVPSTGTQCQNEHERRRFVHHDGSVYFYYPHLQSVTKVEYDDAQKFTAFVEMREKLLGAFQRLNGADRRWELYLDILEPNTTSHLFVLLDDEACFQFDGEGPSLEETSLPKARFWKHLETFPMHDPRFPSRWGVEFLNALAFGSNERILEHKETTFPFTDEQSKCLVRVYNDLQACSSARSDIEHSALSSLLWHVARTMATIQETRDRYNYGTPDARMYRNVALDKLTFTISLIDFILLFCSFGTHRMYRTRLQATRVQGVVYLPDFRELVRSFLVEWGDSNLLATVFVSASVAFLAVPNISDLQRSASLASSVYAMASILTGVHHVWQHRGKVEVSLAGAENYLGQQPNSQLRDLTIRGVFLSLPISLLLWSVISFGLAIAAYSMTETGLWGRVLICVILGVLGIFGALTVRFFWEIWGAPRREEIGLETASEYSGGWVGNISERIRGVVNSWFK